MTLRQAQDEVRQGERESELKRGGEVASRLAHNQEIAGSSPARATIFGTVTGEGVAVRLSDPTAMLLKLVASHDGLTAAQAIDRLVCARAEEIGISCLLSAAEPPSAPGGASQGGRGAPGRAARRAAGGQP